MNEGSTRYIELDLLRTLAILLMVVYHACYDLEIFYGWKLGMFNHWGWTALQEGTAGLFLLLVGCSFAISWNRHQARHPDEPFPFRYRKYLLRGMGVVACGLLVSAVTYGMDAESYVRFGILHLIGTSILLLPFFGGMKEWTAAIGLAIVCLGIGLGIGSSVTAETSLLLPLGVMPPDFFSVDYFPLIPWFGIVLIGYATGYFCYVRLTRDRNSLVSSVSHARRRRALAWPGRHALAIYLAHQPILLLLLALTQDMVLFIMRSRGLAP